MSHSVLDHEQQLAQLAERRQQLVAQAAAQRTTLANNMEPWRVRLALVDRAQAG